MRCICVQVTPWCVYRVRFTATFYWNIINFLQNCMFFALYYDQILTKKTLRLPYIPYYFTLYTFFLVSDN